MAGQPSLLDMPKVVMERILYHSDYPAFASLRKTSYDLRHFMKESASKCPIPAIYIKKRQESVILKFRSKRGISNSCQAFSTKGGQVNIEYVSHPKGCMVVIEKKRDRKTQRLLREQCYIDVFCKDLKVLMDQPDKYVMEEFKLDFDMMVLEQLKKGQLKSFEHFMGRITATFKQREQLLRTENFIMKIKLEEEVKMMLPFFDPSHLKKIHFLAMIPPKPVPNFLTSYMYLCSDFLTSIEQWRRADHMIIEGIQILGSVEGFLHLKKFEIRTNEVEFRKFELMMENMLVGDDQTRHFRILTDDSTLPMVRQRYGASADNKYYFHAPQTKLILEMWSSKFSFEMKLIPRSEVPKKRTIRNFYR